MDDNKLEILENRLKDIENMLIHLHGHLECILDKIEFHDIRLTRSLCLLLNKYPETEIDKVLNIDIDISYIEECYTPISEDDKNIYQKKLQALRDIREHR